MIAGVSSYSFMQYIRAGKMTQLDAVRKAAELGFAAIEFTELTPHDGSSKEAYAKAIVREAGRYNMQISAYAVSACLIQPTAEQTRAELVRVKREIDVAAMLGVPVMRHDAYFAQRKYKSFDQSLPELAAHIRELAGYAEACGIQTAVENHGQICQDSDRMERLFNAVNHPNFGLLADIGNFMCANESRSGRFTHCAVRFTCTCQGLSQIRLRRQRTGAVLYDQGLQQAAGHSTRRGRGAGAAMPADSEKRRL